MLSIVIKTSLFVVCFVFVCAALLGQGVCVSIVDLVTTWKFNIYTELLAFIDQSDPAFAPVRHGRNYNLLFATATSRR